MAPPATEPISDSPHTDLDDGAIRSAGGIIRRIAEDATTQIALIFRQRRGDWTFPKGKVGPGESLEQAALREVYEETGMRCRIDHEIGVTQYTHRSGKPKVVTYYLMTGDDGTFTANLEVDELVWMNPADAGGRLTWNHDRELLERAAAQPIFMP